jgi:glycosyltransferase involved in cell wall biosynthesis
MMTEKQKHVCMIAYTSYTTECRGRLEAEALVNMGYDVTFLVLKESSSPRTYSDGRVTVRELNVRKYRGESFARYIFSYLAFVVLAFVACTRLFLSRNLDAVHVHNMPDFLVFAAFVPRLCGCKLVLDIHDSMPETYAGKFATNSRILWEILRMEERLCCWFANRVVCVNHVQRQVLVDRGISQEKIAVILSIPKFTPLERPPAHAGKVETFRMVYHGTISMRLGIDLAVEAVSRLASRIPELEFHIYGSGEDLPFVKQRAKDLGVDNRVFFNGIVDWDRLPEELITMDAGIVANRRNIATELMLPAKLMDYVSLGIPVVAPHLKAIDYYFSPDMISPFEPEDIHGMCEAIMLLYADKAQRMHQAMLAKRFLEKYRWDKKECSMRQLYDGGAVLHEKHTHDSLPRVPEREPKTHV